MPEDAKSNFAQLPKTEQMLVTVFAETMYQLIRHGGYDVPVLRYLDEPTLRAIRPKSVASIPDLQEVITVGHPMLDKIKGIQLIKESVASDPDKLQALKAAGKKPENNKIIKKIKERLDKNLDYLHFSSPPC